MSFSLRRVYRLGTVFLTLVLLWLASACTLSAPPQQAEDLTSIPTNTVPPTRTPVTDVELPTALPFIPTAITGFSQPTAVSLLPPTTIPRATNTPLPISIVILSPVPGNVVAGNVQVLGSATHPQFLQYQVEYGPDSNPGNLWFPASGVQRSPVINGLLGIWNTNAIDDGRYQVRLRVVLRDGTSLVTVVNNIQVQNRQPTPVPTATTIPRPIAAFGQSTTTGVAPLIVNFFNQSQGEITGYNWNFSDGGSSTEINPTYTFRNPGVYTVTLTATGPGGSSNVSRQISVQSQTPPIASFTQNRTTGPSPLTVTFQDTSQGNITGRLWNFGDNTTSIDPNPSHTFTDVGTYNVLLTVEGPGGSSSSIRQITVENPAVPEPDAAFSASASQGTAPLTVDFSVNDTSNIDNYEWVFGGAGTSTAASPQVTFTDAGSYVVNLTVIGEGGQDTDQTTIIVEQAPDAPDISIVASPMDGDAPLTVNFSVESNGGDITAYAWDFGDGTTSNQAEPRHVFDQPGSYPVTLSVEGDGGTDSDMLTVNALQQIAEPEANFDTSLVQDGTLRTIQFNNQSNGDELTYSWDFGDGTTSNEASPQHTYGDFGTYNITFSATNSAGTSTVTRQIVVEPPLQPIISADVTSGTAPLTVNFDASGSTGTITGYAWDFGDGETGTGATIQHVYAASGSYLATLTVTDESGATETAQQPIEINEGLQAVLVADVTSGTVPLTVNFDASGSTGTITGYAWDFGDGETGTGATVQHVYAASGSYLATLTVTDESGATETAQQPIEVSEGLQAVLVADTTSGTVPLTVNFDASGSSGTITGYAWDFGDGETATGATIQHVYAAAGSYLATLTVTDESGATETAQQPIEVSEGLQAVLVADTTSGTAPLPVNFDASGSTGTITGYAWDFGDGETGTGATIQHVYAASGSYLATLTVTDESGATETAQQPIEVSEGLQAVLVADTTSGTAPLTVNFDASGSSGTITGYAWDFGDGETGTGATIQHVYAAAGSYLATLTVTDESGATETAQQPIEVSEGLQAVLVADTTSGTAPLTVNFDASGSSGTITGYAWDFGDGETGTGATAQHVYAASGSYLATLMVTDESGATETAQQPIEVSDGLQAVLVADTTSGTAPLTVNFDASGSSGTITGYAWDFGDGETGTGATAQHVYAASGSYLATLTVTDESGATETAQQPIEVSEGLQAVLVADTTSGTAPLTVNFDASGSTGTITGYAWDFGDGETGTGATAQHVYAASGSYLATLTVTDESGATETAQQPIEVSEGLQAVLVADTTSGTAPLTVNFDASGSSGDISSFSWDFGDGTTSTEVSPVKIYETPGSYTATLTVSDVGGGTSTAEQPIQVDAPSAPPPDPAIMFVGERDGNRQIYVMNADGSNVTRLTNNGNTDDEPDWSSTNEIVFVRDGVLHLMGSDGSNQRPLSPDGGATLIPGRFPRWSPDSAQIAFTNEADGNREIYVVNADGSGLTRLTDLPGEDQQADWSPDGARLAFVSNRDGNREIYVMNADGSNVTRLTTSDNDDVQPIWSGDGTRIAFASDRDGNREIYVMNADGSNATRLTNNGVVDAQPAWTSDNNTLIFATDRDGNREIYSMSAADGNSVTRLTDNAALDTQPVYRP